jgi:hypothetical protein
MPPVAAALVVDALVTIGISSTVATILTDVSLVAGCVPTSRLLRKDRK